MVHVVRREIPPTYWLDLLFHHFLYPLKPLLLHASTFLTVFMARERYKAIRHPLEYRNATAGVSPWRTAAKYVAPMVLAAAAFVSPLYFEVGQRPIKEELVVTLENGSQYLVRSSIKCPVPPFYEECAYLSAKFVGNIAIAGIKS